ncbi:MAG: carotenoid biosynthesis protein [Metallosphaera sp.]
MEKIWIVSYSYLLYLFLATLPSLTNLPGFGNGVPVIALIALYFFHSYLTLGKRAINFFLVSFSIGLIAEIIGVNTGLLFGRYYYTPYLGFEVFNVPILIPFLWSTLGYFSYVPTRNYLISPLFMVIIDLAIDPLFSKFDWHWIHPGPYFGVPIYNFVSWYVVSMLIYLSFQLTCKEKSFQFDPKAAIFVYGLVLNLALQDYFTGLILALIAPVVLSSLLLLSLHVLVGRLRNSKPISEHKDS